MKRNMRFGISAVVHHLFAHFHPDGSFVLYAQINLENFLGDGRTRSIKIFKNSVF